MSDKNKNKDKINLTDLNKQKKSFSPPKLKNPFKKQTGPNRDDVGKFATTSGGGGLKSIKKFNWKRATPLIAIVTLVGGFLVFQSFAAVAPGNRVQQRVSDIGLCKRSGIDKELRGSYSNVVSETARGGQGWVAWAYNRIWGATPEVSEKFKWFDRAKQIHDEYRSKGDKVGYTCKVAYDVYNEMQQTAELPKRLTQPVIEDKDIKATGDNIVQTIYAKDMLVHHNNPNVGSSGKWVKAPLENLQATLGTMNGSFGKEDYEVRSQYSYENENVVEETALAGNYVTAIDVETDSRYAPNVYPLPWDSEWGEKIKVCAVAYEGGDTARAVKGTTGIKRDYNDSSLAGLTMTMNIGARYTHKQSPSKSGEYTRSLKRNKFELKNLKNYNADEVMYFANPMNPYSAVVPFGKFYICSDPISKKLASTRLQNAVITEIAPRVISNKGRNKQIWKTEPGSPWFLIVRLVIL